MSNISPNQIELTRGAILSSINAVKVSIADAKRTCANVQKNVESIKQKDGTVVPGSEVYYTVSIFNPDGTVKKIQHKRYDTYKVIGGDDVPILCAKLDGEIADIENSIIGLQKLDRELGNTAEIVTQYIVNIQDKLGDDYYYSSLFKALGLQNIKKMKYGDLECFYQTNPDLNLDKIILDGYSFNKNSEIEPLSLKKGGCGISNFIMIYYLFYGKKLDFVETAKEAVNAKLYNGRGSEYYYYSSKQPNKMFEDYKISVKKIEDKDLNIGYIRKQLKKGNIITSVVQYGKNNYKENGFNPSPGGHYVSIIDYDKNDDLYYVYNPYTYTYEDGTKKNTSGWYSKSHIQKYYIDVIDSDASVMSKK